MSPTQKQVTQSVAKAAAKTFLQAALAILALLAVPELTSWAGTIRDGGTVSVDAHWWAQVLIAAVGGGIAALISLAWNWSKS